VSRRVRCSCGQPRESWRRRHAGITFHAMVPATGRTRWSWVAAVTITTIVTACGGAGQTHGDQHRQSSKAGRRASAHEAALTDGTATVPTGISSASLPDRWTACPATATDDAGGASPVVPGCGFVRATEVQVQELLHNEGSTVFNTPESIGVSYRNEPVRLLNCTAQNNGPTIVCADNGVPWVVVFRAPGQ